MRPTGFEIALVADFSDQMVVARVESGRERAGRTGHAGGNGILQIRIIDKGRFVSVGRARWDAPRLGLKSPLLELPGLLSGNPVGVVGGNADFLPHRRKKLDWTGEGQESGEKGKGQLADVGHVRFLLRGMEVRAHQRGVTPRP